MGKPILCLDFDGVIHGYQSGWKGADVIDDPPVPGAMAFLIEAVEHFDVQIFSSRTHQPGGLAAMAEYVCGHLTDLIQMRCEPGLSIAAVLGGISYPKNKPPALVSIDDRAICFTGEWPEIETLKSFKPWNKK